MKKFKFLSLALAALALGACSSSDDVAEGGGNESNTSYVTVNIKNVGAPATRALSSSDFEDGTDAENAISSVSFCFFKSDGSAYTMQDAQGNTTNVITKTDVTMNNEASDFNIEEVSNVVLVLNGESKVAPASVIAVINETLTGNVSKDQAIAKANDYRLSLSRTNFVMSNSVYGNTTEVSLEGKVWPTSAEATANPVDIYVERVLAKVSINLNGSGFENTTVPGATKRIKVGTTSLGKEVYALLLGWGVADGNAKSYLVKHLSASYTNLGIDPWTTNDYHRSFWADACTYERANISYNKYKSQSFSEPFYTQENTPTTPISAGADIYNNNTLSKVLVIAQLVDASNNALAISTYRGSEYIGEADVKTAIANFFSTKYYKGDGGSGYKSIEPSDIELKTVDDLGSAASGDMKRYEVVAQLKVPSTQFYTYDGTNYNQVTSDDVNTELKKERAQVRTEGAAYYYAPIRHLADTEGALGYYGVVRNHVYKIDITDMKGFGTPVYDPDEVIIPEVPSDEKVYLATKINVLSWRIVKQTVNLNKTK